MNNKKNDKVFLIDDLNLTNLLIAFSPVIIAFLGNAIINKYNIRKDFKPKNIKKVSLPPEIKKSDKEIDKMHISTLSLGKEILNFVKVIEEKMPNANLDTLYNNLKSLSIEIKEESKSKISKFLSSHSFLGYYDDELNKIVILKGYEDVNIYHELFHMMSTVSEKNIAYFGFYQWSEKLSVAKGLNEGYTELLTQRYFYNGKERKHYYYERLIASLVEDIIEKEKMELFYATANLSGVINELEKYESKENIISFLVKLDVYNKYALNIKTKYIKILEKLLKDMIKFLINCYGKKLFYEMNELNYSNEKIEEDLNKFIFKTKEILTNKELEDFVSNNEYLYFSDDEQIKK